MQVRDTRHTGERYHMRGLKFQYAILAPTNANEVYQRCKGMIPGHLPTGATSLLVYEPVDLVRQMAFE